MVPRRSHRSRAVAAGVTRRASTRTLPIVCTEITTARATATYRDRSASRTCTPAARALSRSRVTATMGRCARNSMSSTNAAPHSTTGTSDAGMPVIDPKRKSCRLPAYPGARAMIATPSAKAPTKSTPMTESSLSLRFCANRATSTAVTTPASAPPNTRDPPHTKAIARPGNTECATASPMNAMPRRTTCTPTLPHTSAATTAISSARGRNASAGFVRSRKKS